MQSGTYFITGYEFGGQELHPIAENGPEVFKILQATCPLVRINGLSSASIFRPNEVISLQIRCLDALGLSSL